MDNLNTLLDELKQLGIAITVNALDVSTEEMALYENKYNLSSYSFFIQYQKNCISKNISKDDIIDWAYNCKCYISAGGDLNPSSKDLYLNNITSHIDFSNILNSTIDFKKEERCSSFFIPVYILSHLYATDH